MTADEFRNLALSLPETVEGEHMGHADFRVRGKIFATLGQDEDWGGVMLKPDEQKVFIRREPDAFQPFNGAWGRRGGTRVELSAADEASVRQALIAAWRAKAPKRLALSFDEE